MFAAQHAPPSRSRAFYNPAVNTPKPPSMPDSRVPAAIRSVIDALPVTEHRARIVEAIRNYR